MRILSLTVLIVCITAGCATSRLDYLGGERFAPRPQNWAIALYDTEADIKRPFVKVARVVGTGAEFATWDAVLRAMKKDARAAGADALILRAETTQVRGIDDAGNFHSDKVREAIAVRYTDEKKQ